MTKRLFQVLDELNVHDGDNNTKHVQIANTLVSANLAKGGGHVTMGVPANIVHSLLTDQENTICLLVVVDRKEYESQNNKP